MNLGSTDKLSTRTYWDDVLKSAGLPRLNTKKAYLYSVTMKFIHEAIKKPEYKTFFEVGCGSSGWLPYFAKEYGFKVSGLDYSEIGCKLAEKNLKLLDVDYGEILCQDFFAEDPLNGKKYDIVFSYGVVEHFKNTADIIQIFKSFTADNGLMITLVPNFVGLAGYLTKHLIPEVYKIHTLITAKQLRSFHEKNAMQIVKNGYAGMFSFGVMPLIKSNHWLLREGTFRRKITLFVFKGIDKVLTTIYKLLPFDLPSRYFSPYIICIAKKGG